MHHSHKVDSLEREFASALLQQVAAAGALPYRAAAARLRALERSYLTKVNNKLLARELRRRIAEQMLHQAIFHGCSLALCRRKLSDLSNLGFATVERKAHFHLIYARCALAHGHKQVAHTTAKSIAAELDRSAKSRLGKELTKSFSDLLRSLEC